MNFDLLMCASVKATYMAIASWPRRSRRANWEVAAAEAMSRSLHRPAKSRQAAPWIFSRADLDGCDVRSLAQRAKDHQKRPTVPHPDQQTLFT